MIDTNTADAEIRRLVRATIERSLDGWTTERLAGRLALPIGLMARILVDLGRRGLVVHLDDEWFAAHALLELRRTASG